MIKEDLNSLYVKSAINVKLGKLVLTATHLEFHAKNNMAAALGGLIGLLIEKWFKLQKFKIILAIPRNEIISFEKSTHGLNKNVLLITTNKNEQHKFVVANVDEWCKIL